MPRLGSPKLYLLVSSVTIIVLTGAFVLGLMSTNKMREIINEQFNQQQLTIAKGVASDITDKFNFLKNELHTLNLSPSVQYLEVSWPNRLQITMGSVKNFGTIEIGLIEARRQKIYRLNAEGQDQVEEADFSQIECLQWASDRDNQNKFFVKRVGPDFPSSSSFSQNPYLLVGLPTYQVSVDESHPVASGQFVGCLYFLVDPSRLTKMYCQEIRSGQTGYAWVIDRQGNFLYHPGDGFIGKSAFEVREQRDPKISFAEINRIQKEKMLTGRQGYSWYWSGWHRGLVKKMKKFIAYAPIPLHGDNASLVWSVAVVAPQTEVEGAIHEVYVRQFLLQGVVILIILLGGGVIIYYESRWSAALEQEVQRKTAALKQSTEELAKSEKLYKSLVESAEDAIINVDSQARIISINRYGVKLFGYTPQGIIGKSIYEVFPGRAGRGIHHQIDQVFTTHSGRRATLQVVVGGKEYYFNLNFTPIREDHRVMGVLIIAHDITSSKKMEEQLYHTEKLASLGQLAAGVAHEINNPLAIILGFTDMLLEKVKADSPEYKILKTIERQGNNCKKIVENLMSFARTPEKEQYFTDINRNIETVMEVFQNTLLTKKVNYHLQLAEDLPLVRGDAAQLQQVFLNLVTNAVNAMPQGGDLTITTGLNSTGDRVQIKFADTGDGIKKECLNKIYDPFFTTRKVGEGTGLGLSVSYAILAKFGGTIECLSRTREEAGDQSGTTFTITLPVASPTDQELKTEDIHVRQDSDH
ncbi:MAG: ATP-binding protein [Desulfobacteraceae bacterium]